MVRPMASTRPAWREVGGRGPQESDQGGPYEQVRKWTFIHWRGHHKRGSARGMSQNKDSDCCEREAQLSSCTMMTAPSLGDRENPDPSHRPPGLNPGTLNTHRARQSVPVILTPQTVTHVIRQSDG